MEPSKAPPDERGDQERKEERVGRAPMKEERLSFRQNRIGQYVEVWKCAEKRAPDGRFSLCLTSSDGFPHGRPERDLCQ